MTDPLAQLDADPIFIVGRFRSGTTWVYDMLTAHPLVGGAFESWMFTRDLGLANLFQPGHFVADDGLFGRDFKLGQLIDRERMVADVRALAASWLAEALEPEHRFLVEKTPSHDVAMPAIAELFPGARFVHVLRDGRDVMVSERAAAESWGKGHFAAPGARQAGSAWEAAVRTARRHGSELGPERFLELRYEELRADPRAGARRLLGFCGIPHDDAIVEQVVGDTDFAKHKTTGESAFRRKGAVGDWRSRVSRADRVRFELGSHGLLAECGYARGRLWWLSAQR